MSRLATYFLILLFLKTGAGDELLRYPQRATVSPAPQGPPGTTPEERGTWLARQVEDRDTGRDTRMAMRMRLFDRQQRVRERALSLIALRGGPGRPVAGDRTLVRFSYPNDIKDTAFLDLGTPERRRRALSLSALARPRPPDRRLRIAGEFRRQRFHVRGHRRPRARRLCVPADRRARRRVDRAGRREAPGLHARVAQPRDRRPLSARRLARPPGQFRRRARRDSQPARRGTEDVRRAEARAGRRGTGRRSSCG